MAPLKKLLKSELKNLFEKARFYPVDIKQKFWELGFHIKALDAEIKLLSDQNDALIQERISGTLEVSSKIPDSDPLPNIEAPQKRAEGMFKPSGVTREQIAFTLYRRQNSSAKDVGAYEGFKNVHGLSDDNMKELHDSWERQKLGQNTDQ